MADKLNILITGGSGLLGSRLVEMLDKSVYNIRCLSRTAKTVRNTTSFKWDIQQGIIDESALQDLDAVVHLAGAGIAEKRWTEERKKELYKSRIAGTKLLLSKLAILPNKPATVISTSAIGYYGNRPNELLTEESNVGDDFLAELCKDWEATAIKESLNNWRLCINRVSVMLSTKGGALREQLKTQSLGFCGYFGNGKQMDSWIHIDDMCRLIIKQIEDQNFNGIYNAVSPEVCSNHQFAKAVKKAIPGIKLILPVPTFSLKLLLGEMSDFLLASQACDSSKVRQDGFAFEFPSLTDAIKDVVMRKI